MFWWVEDKDIDADKEWILSYLLPQKVSPKNSFSAFTVAELGELLPWKIVVDNVPTGLAFFREVDSFCIEHVNIKSLFVKAKTCAPTEAEVRAEALIYLLENKLITI